MILQREKILLAGASGRLGRHLAPLLAGEGFALRTLSRRKGAEPRTPSGLESVTADLTREETLRGVCEGVDCVISAAGASLDVADFSERRGFDAIDHMGNRNLLKAALASGCRKFIYVSVFGGRSRRELEYCDAHERFVDALHAAPIESCVLRPTGFYGIYDDILKLAARGVGIIIGDGSALTNPIHEADLAGLCRDAIDGDEREVDCGGPEVHSRRELLELAFSALSRPARIISMPPSLFLASATLISPLNGRIADLLRFGVAVSTSAVVAPRRGSRDMASYFRSRGGELAPSR